MQISNPLLAREFTSLVIISNKAFWMIEEKKKSKMSGNIAIKRRTINRYNLSNNIENRIGKASSQEVAVKVCKMHSSNIQIPQWLTSYNLEQGKKKSLYMS